MSEKEEEVARLIHEAHEAIGACDISKAIKIGRRLKKLRHSSAFEIMALAYADDEKPGRAIKVLEEGVQKAPLCWLLWQLLGNYYSEQKRHRDSQKCYRQALQCPQVDPSSVHLNIAIGLGRHGDHEAALRHVNQVTSKELEVHATAHKMHVLNSLGRFREAHNLGKRKVAALERACDDAHWLAELHAELGVALWSGRRDKSRALRHAWKAIELDGGLQRAIWLIREVTYKVSPAARYMRLLVRGRWYEALLEGESTAPGFFANYDAVADTPEEALEFIKPFEPKPVRSSLVSDEVKVLKKTPDWPKGFYGQVGGYAFFPWVEPDSTPTRRRAKRN